MSSNPVTALSTSEVQSTSHMKLQVLQSWPVRATHVQYIWTNSDCHRAFHHFSARHLGPEDHLNHPSFLRWWRNKPRTRWDIFDTHWSFGMKFLTYWTPLSSKTKVSVIIALNSRNSVICFSRSCCSIDSFEGDFQVDENRGCRETWSAGRERCITEGNLRC